MSPKEETLGFLLADVARLMRRTFQRHLSCSTLTLAQARTLVRVSRNQAIRQVDLADFLQIQPNTLARLIDQLAELGLVERRPDPDDRRAYQIYLTAKADAQLAVIREAGAETRAHALRGLKAAEAAALVSALQQMRANLAVSERQDI